MQPYYQDEWTTIYHADCRDVLPMLEAGSVDLVLTDPPYGIGWAPTSKHKRNPKLFGLMENDDGSLPVLSILAMCLVLLKRHRHVYCFGLRDFGDLPIASPTELIWDKGMLGIGNLSVPWAPSHEPILFGVYNSSKQNRLDGDGRLAARLRRGSVLRVPRVNGSAVVRHPTEKPVLLLRQLIESSSLFGEVVLDCFMGSGSTLVAARLEGRRAIGIEINEAYCEVAVKRLQQQVLPLETPDTSREVPLPLW